jgi:mannose-6-phosphate isomerase class I
MEESYYEIELLLLQQQSQYELRYEYFSLINGYVNSINNLSIPELMYALNEFYDFGMFRGEKRFNLTKNQSSLKSLSLKSDLKSQGFLKIMEKMLEVNSEMAKSMINEQVYRIKLREILIDIKDFMK